MSAITGLPLHTNSAYSNIDTLTLHQPVGSVNMHSIVAKLQQAEVALTDAGQMDLAADVGLALRVSSEQLQPALHFPVS